MGYGLETIINRDYHKAGLRIMGYGLETIINRDYHKPGLRIMGYGLETIINRNSGLWIRRTSEAGRLLRSKPFVSIYACSGEYLFQ